MGWNEPTSDLSAIYQRWECGASEDSQPLRTDIDPHSYAKTTMLWVKDLGVSLVGGCCGIGPGNTYVYLSFYNRIDFNTYKIHHKLHEEYIAEMKKCFKSQGLLASYCICNDDGGHKAID